MAECCTFTWPSRDPLGEEGGINLYGFNYNAPTNYWDYLGLNANSCTPDGDPWLTRVSWTTRFDTPSTPTLIATGLFGLNRRVPDLRTSDFLVPAKFQFNIKVVVGPNKSPGKDYGTGDSLDIPVGTKTLPVVPNVDSLPSWGDYDDGVYPCLIRVRCNQKCKCCDDEKTVSWTPRNGIWADFIPGRLYKKNPYSTLPVNTGWECRPERGFEESGWNGRVAKSFCSDEAAKKNCAK